MNIIISIKKYCSTLIALILVQFSNQAFSQATVNLDPTFIIGTGFDLEPTDLLIQPDGKVLVSGNFTTYNGIQVNSLIRLNGNGTIDTSFHTGSGFLHTFPGFVFSAIAIQQNGKIIVGGDFTGYNGFSCNNIARLNPNGSYDTTFHIGIGFDQGVGYVAIRSDGKILVTGGFTNYNGTNRTRGVLLYPNGTIDSTFNIGGYGVSPMSSGQVITCYYLQSDNKLLVGGKFALWNSTSVTNLVRLDTLGNLDIGFAPSTNNDIYNVVQQPDGKILVGGLFTVVNGVTRNKLVRLNNNGTIDFTFNTGAGFTINSSPVMSDVGRILLQPDGKIITGGSFDACDGHSTAAIARLNSNGSFDSTFNVGIGFHDISGQVSPLMKLQSDGKIIAYYSFYDFNTASCNNITRLDGPALAISVQENKSFLPYLNLYPNPASQEITIDLNEGYNKPYSLTVINALGECIMHQTINLARTCINLEDISKGFYFVIIEQDGSRAIQRFVKE